MLMKNNKWFQESIESLTYQEHLDDVQISLPAFEDTGFFEVEAASSAGLLDPAFHVAKWVGPKHPTILYHHGNNETPFKYGIASKNTFQSILFARKDEIDANLISIRAAFHNHGMKPYLEKMRSMDNFTAMLSVSAKLIEALLKYLRSLGSRQVIVTGISLGGWVTNLHRAFFHSADTYIPIFAGAALDQLFLSSAYKRLVSDFFKENPDTVKYILNFEKEFLKNKDDNVFPLLAQYDRFIEYDVQKKSYEGPVKVIQKGHITGALSAKLLCSHILAQILK
jgi:hypothetical protein